MPTTTGLNFRAVCQKKWITSRVLNNIESAADIAKRYNIRRKYINILVQRMRKRSYLRNLPGRPRVLDAESQQKIETSIVDMTPPYLSNQGGIRCNPPEIGQRRCCDPYTVYTVYTVYGYRRTYGSSRGRSDPFDPIT